MIARRILLFLLLFSVLLWSGCTPSPDVCDFPSGCNVFHLLFG